MYQIPAEFIQARGRRYINLLIIISNKKEPSQQFGICILHIFILYICVLHLETKLPMFPHQCDRPNFKPIQNKRQNYSSVFPSLYIFLIANWKNKILHRVLAFPVPKLVLISS
jgi:hypothetical protein